MSPGHAPISCCAFNGCTEVTGSNLTLSSLYSLRTKGKDMCAHCGCRCLPWRAKSLVYDVWELCCRTPLFPLFFLFIARPPVLGMTLNCIIMPHDYYNNTWHMLMVKIPCIGYNSWTWSINFKALRCQLMTIGDSDYWQHGMSTLSQRTSSITNTLLP